MIQVLFLVCFASFTRAQTQLLVYYVAGPLIANFSYDKYLLPNGSAKTNCSQDWFQVPVQNFSATTVDTVHVTADFLFSGWNDTRVLQQISFEYVTKLTSRFDIANT